MNEKKTNIISLIYFYIHVKDVIQKDVNLYKGKRYDSIIYLYKINIYDFRWFSYSWTLNITKRRLEQRGIDPRTSHMLSERSTIWATAPVQ